MKFYKSLNLDNIKLKGNIFSAPLAGITNLPTRIIFSKFGADVLFTEMVSANGIVYNDKKTINLLKDEEHLKSIVQIFGSDPDILADAVKFINDNTDYEIINLNMGCPVKKVLKSGSGGALLKNEKLIEKIFNKITKASVKQITIKIRSGWDKNSINFIKISEIAEYYGIKLVILHPRTVKQMFTGFADWSHIKELKKNSNLLIVGNGDIDSPEKAKEMFEQTNCDGIMIARASIGFPWIFSMVKDFLLNNSYVKDISTQERVNVMLEHLRLSIKYFGETKGIKEFRIQLLHYIKNFKYSSKIRGQLQTLETYDSIISVLKKYNLI